MTHRAVRLSHFKEEYMKVIIYNNEDGLLSIFKPVDGLATPLEEVAKIIVPNGVFYRIIDESDIPADRTFRAAWEADFTNPDGVGV